MPQISEIKRSGSDPSIFKLGFSNSDKTSIGSLIERQEITAQTLVSPHQSQVSSITCS